LQVVLGQVSLLLPAIIGIIVALVLPCCTIFYLCCRCCGNCGGNVQCNDAHTHKMSAMRVTSVQVLVAVVFIV